MRVKLCLVVIATILAVIFFEYFYAATCIGDTPECLVKKISQHKVRSHQHWKTYFSTPVSQRVFYATPEILDYLDLEKRLAGFQPDSNRFPAASTDTMEEIRNALSSMPNSVLEGIQHKLIGVFLVRGLGQDSIVEVARDRSGVPTSGLILVDPDYTQGLKLKDWYEHRENNIFKKNGSYRVKVGLTNSKSEDRNETLRFILLHQIGHIFAINENYIPDHMSNPEIAHNSAPYPFFKITWKVNLRETQFDTIFDSTVFPMRNRIQYYAPPLLSNEEIPTIYDQLVRTNFVSLLAATSPFDDFSESFASYVHTEILNQPFSLTIESNDETVLSIPNCWETPRCEEKKAFLSKILGEK